MSPAQEPDDIRRLNQIIRADPDLMQLLTAACRVELPHWRLGGGCIYQTVWNALTGRPRRTGIKDYDLVYFDSSDLSWEAEDAVIQQVAAAIPPLPGDVEVRNHARVPMWFEERFGFPCPPVTHLDDVFRQYPLRVQAIGVRLGKDGNLSVLCPFGLEDLFAMRVRPNRTLPNRAIYEEKAKRLVQTWPELTVEPW